MEQIKHIFIINPAAGKTDSTNPVAAAIRAAAAGMGADYEILTTEYPRHAPQLVREKARAYEGRHLRFYACGGDGTLNEVAAGVVGLEKAAVTHYPCGSGNDFIKVFGVDGRVFSDLEELMRGREIELDYIQSDCGVCVNVFSVGVDARIARGMQKYKRIPLLHGTMAYHASTVEHLIRGLHQPYGVEIDGKSYDGRYTLILAGNGRFYGGGIHPVPDADPEDGLLDVLLVQAVSRFTAAKVIGAYESGRYREYPQYITHSQAKELTIFHQNGKDMTISLDGEIVQASRVSLRVAPQKLRFVIPQRAKLLPPRRVE